MTDEIVVSLPPSGLDAAFGDLERCMEEALARGPRAVVLDMRAVEKLSSTTVALVMWARRRCAGHGVDVVLRHTTRRCREAIERTALLEAVRVEGSDPGDGRL